MMQGTAGKSTLRLGLPPGVWHEQVGLIGLYAFALFYQLNATVAYIGQDLMVLAFVFQARQWMPVLKRDLAVYLFLGLMLFIAAYAGWASHEFPETQKAQWLAVGNWLHWLAFIPVGWQLFQHKAQLNGVLLALAAGLLIRIVLHVDWLDLPNIFHWPRTGFGFTETVFAPLAGVSLLGFITLAPRITTPQPLTLPLNTVRPEPVEGRASTSSARTGFKTVPQKHLAANTAYKALRFGLWLLGFLVLLESLILSQTRGVWVAAAVVFPLAAAVRYWDWLKNKAFTSVKSLVALVLILAIGGVFIQQNADHLVKRLSFSTEDIHKKYDDRTMEGEETRSVGYRLILWRLGLENWAARPVFGWGPGSTELVLQQSAKPPLVNSEGRVIYSHLHSLYIELLVRFGLIGTLFFLSLPIFLTHGIWKAYTAGHIPKDYTCFLLAGWGFTALAATFDFQIFKFAWRNYCVIWASLSYAPYLETIIPTRQTPIPEPMSRRKQRKTSEKSSIVIYRRLIGYGMPYWKMFAVSVVSMAIYALLGPALAKFIQPLIDGSFIHNDPTFLRQAPLFLMGLSIIRGITGFLGDYCSGWVGRRIIADMRRQLFDQFLSLPCGYYDRASSGELLSKLLYNTEQVAQAMTEGAVNLIKDGLSMVGLTALMLYENIQLSMIFLIVGPILGYSVRKITLRFRKISARIQDSMGSVGHVAQEVIEAQRIVKVFNGKAYETVKFAYENEHNQKQQMKLITTNAMSGSVIQLIYISGFSAILYAVSLDSVRETITPGSLIAFIAAMAMMQSPIKRFTQAIGVIQKGVAASESIFEMVDSERERDIGSLELDHVEGRIEYRTVSLGYQERQDKALDSISLTVPAGKTIALVGQSGSGKTSLIRLLPRLYESTEGQILIDGHDIRDFTLANLRKHIAYVGQEVTLFNDTVANNIAYGIRDAVSPEQIREAARAAYALDFIEDLPQGFDTQVGQQGIVLSGGQRQRIAIARALLKNAPILILDEATSALDAESERYVQDALDVLMRNRTTLIVAHRLSTIQNAERIYVMRAGQILEAGTHEELMGKDSFYAELNRMQFSQAYSAG